MKARELRKKSDEELKEIKKDLEMQLIKAKVQKGAKSKNPKKTNYGIFKELRKGVAQINTILRENALSKM